jgi:hypothetical protein
MVLVVRSPFGSERGMYHNPRSVANVFRRNWRHANVFAMLFPMTKKKKAPVKKRKVLVILCNRWDRNQKSKFLELDCDPEGNILRERTLRSTPRERLYDEVWENDEGRSDFAACHRFKRLYGHKLQKT